MRLFTDFTGISRRPAAVNPSGRYHPRRRCVLGLERLEDRRVPSTVTNLNDSGPGSLRDAIAITPAGGTVGFQRGLTGTITLTTGELLIDKDLTIAGPGAGDITLDGNRASRVFNIVTDSTVVLSGLTITDGLSNRGGGIYNAGMLTVIASTIDSNSVTFSSQDSGGGGIYNAGMLTVIASTIDSNSVTYSFGGQVSGGGGIYNAGTLTVTGSTFDGNSVRFSISSGVNSGGGGIFNNGSLTVTGSSFISNTGDVLSGSGIDNLGGTATITDSTFESNSGTGSRAGGIYSSGMLTVFRSTFRGNGFAGIADQGTLTVTGCTFSGNSAGLSKQSGMGIVTGSVFTGNSNSSGFGGGIDIVSGTMTVTNSAISGNTAEEGGGISNSGTLTIADSTISGNTANHGGGITTFLGVLTVTNSTISGNTARNSGGGIDNDTQGIMTITSSTISGNSAPTGGGIFFNFAKKSTIKNTILAGNTAFSSPDVGGVVDSQGHNLIGDGTGGSGFSGTDLVGTSSRPINPLLGPLQNNGGPTQTMTLLPDSPAIDAGDNTDAPPTDQRGALRGPVGLDAGAGADIGAYEASSSYLVTSSGDGSDVGTLRTAVGWANNSTNANPAYSANPAPNTILFDTAGTFAIAQTITLTNGPLILGNISTQEAISGPGASRVTISGNSASQVFVVLGGATASLSGLTITGGTGVLGGGISNSGILMITDSTLSGNSALDGGGIYNSDLLAIAGSTLSDNSAVDAGGGIFNDGGGVALAGVTIRRNSAARGGGILNTNGGVLALNANDIADNDGGDIVDLT